MEAFPLVIRGFDMYYGSEYINDQLAAMRDKLRIEFTKSRSRHTNGNVLVESKNASVMHKPLSYNHTPARPVQIVSTLLSKLLAPHLNHHRPRFSPSNSR